MTNPYSPNPSSRGKAVSVELGRAINTKYSEHDKDSSNQNKPMHRITDLVPEMENSLVPEDAYPKIRPLMPANHMGSTPTVLPGEQYLKLQVGGTEGPDDITTFYMGLASYHPPPGFRGNGPLVSDYTPKQPGDPAKQYPYDYPKPYPPDNTMKNDSKAVKCYVQKSENSSPAKTAWETKLNLYGEAFMPGTMNVRVV
jgi:hypothetical protein